MISGYDKRILLSAIKNGDYRIIINTQLSDGNFNISELYRKFLNNADVRYDLKKVEKIINFLISENSKIKKKLICLLLIEVLFIQDENKKNEYESKIKNFILKLNAFSLEDRIKKFLNMFVKTSLVLQEIIKNQNFNNYNLIFILKTLR